MGPMWNSWSSATSITGESSLSLLKCVGGVHSARLPRALMIIIGAVGQFILIQFCFQQ